MDAFISHFGYTDDTASRISGLAADDDMERGLAKLGVMLASGAISQGYFEREKAAFVTRNQEREQRSKTSAEREAAKALALAAKTKQERQQRQAHSEALKAAEHERLRQVDYQRRARSEVAAQGRGRVVGGPTDCLETADQILRQPGQASAFKARRLAKRGLAGVRKAGRHDLEGRALLLLADTEERLGQVDVAAALRHESAALQRRAPRAFSSSLREGLEQRDGYAMAELRALALFHGTGLSPTKQGATSQGSGVGPGVAAPSASDGSKDDDGSLPDNAAVRGLLRAESRLRSLLTPAPAPEPQPSVWEELAQVQYDRINSRVPPALSQKDRQLALTYGSGSRRRTGKDDILTKKLRSTGGGASEQLMSFSSSRGTLRPLETSEVLRLPGESEAVARGNFSQAADQTTKFTGSEWLGARRHARTKKPLCAFESGPSGRCRLCHCSRRHSNHRPRTPDSEQSQRQPGALTTTAVRNSSPFRTEMMRAQQQQPGVAPGLILALPDSAGSSGSAMAATIPLAMQHLLLGHTKKLLSAASAAGGAADGVPFAPSAASAIESITVLNTKEEEAALVVADEAALEAKHGLGPNGVRPAPLPAPIPAMPKGAKTLLREEVPAADASEAASSRLAHTDFVAGRRTDKDNHGESSSSGDKAELDKPPPASNFNAAAATAVAEEEWAKLCGDHVAIAQNKLASVLEGKWDEQWIALQRSLPSSVGFRSKKHAARQRELAELRQREAKIVQAAWDQATAQAEREQREAEAKQREREAACIRARALEAEQAAAQLEQEREYERLRQVRQQEKEDRERKWHAQTTGGFEGMLDGYGFLGHGGGVVMRDGSVRPLREVLEQRRVLEGRVWAGHGH